MTPYEDVLIRQASDLCLVVGDVTSTMACAITARKLSLEVAHVEAGLRSGDWSMPEEINRVVTDSISSWCLTTTHSAGENLKRAGMPDERILLVGNTMSTPSSQIWIGSGILPSGAHLIWRRRNILSSRFTDLQMSIMLNLLRLSLRKSVRLRAVRRSFSRSTLAPPRRFARSDRCRKILLRLMPSPTSSSIFW